MPHNEDDGIWAAGETEDAAIVSLAKGMRWRLWNEEPTMKMPLNSRSLVKSN